MAPRPKFLIFCTFTQVFIAAGQSAVKQYFHVTGVGPHSHSAGLSSLPTVGFTRQAMSNAGLATVPNAGLAIPNGGLTIPNGGVAPSTGISALGALAALPGLLQALTTPSASPSQAVPTSTGVPTLQTQALQPSPPTPSVPTSKQNTVDTNTTNGGLDSAVLNNLAIALQLLIVSNILNSNLPENEANPIYEMLETAKNIPTSLSPTQSSSNPPPSQQTQDPFAQYLPNANFVGTSGFSEGTVSDPYIKPTARNSFQLMSPYEALGPNSPFSDPILASPYGSFMTSKKDFQSPYMMMDSDPFSMNDLF